MLIRPVQPTDAAIWQRFRETFWPTASGEHAGEIERFFRGDRLNPMEVFLAINDSGEAIGFAEVSIRNFAEGCSPGAVGYLEGWFVDPAWRRQGVGSALVSAAEDWSRARGLTEFASDVAIDNAISADGHRSLGFEEVGRTICFRKTL